MLLNRTEKYGDSKNQRKTTRSKNHKAKKKLRITPGPPAKIGRLHKLPGVKSTFTVDKIEPRHDKTNKMVCAPSEDSDQPGHLPSLIRVFAVH